jgi:hypothetical protein
MQPGLRAIEYRRGQFSLVASTVTIGAVLTLIVLCPTRARADDVDDFSAARDAYNDSDYNQAAQRLAIFLARVPPVSPILATPARKYLIASLVLTQHETEAVRMLEDLLRADPDVQFNQREFSPIVLQLVAQTRERLGPELQRIREQHRSQLHAAEQRREDQRRQLAELLTTERVVVEIPRWTMFVPFGFGQFTNRDIGLGAMFAIVESLGIVAGIIGYVGYANAATASNVTMGPGCAQGSGNTYAGCMPWIVTNVAGFSATAAAAVIGIVQANIAYRPERTETRHRPVPPALQNLQIAVGRSPDGTGGAVSVGFRF